MCANIPKTAYPRIVVIGAGFAGIEFIKRLNNEKVQIVLLDRHNYHTFQPLLYQVATGVLEPDAIAYPIRKIFKKQTNFLFRMAAVVSIDTQKKTVETSIGNIDYDELVIATGSKTNYFGLKDFEANAVPMKSIPESLNLRSMLLQNFEEALLVTNEAKREAMINIAIVGGGPTGVELAGTIAEMKHHIFSKEYPELLIDSMQIHVIDKLPRLLSAMSAVASQKSQEFLAELGVMISLDTEVKSYDGAKLELSNGKTISTRTVIWAAGVAGSVIPGVPEQGVIRSRYKVDLFNQVAGCDNVYAIGDVAAVITDETPNGHPMLAPVAMQQGKLLADNLLRKVANKPLVPFEFKNPGVMATIGRKKAVVDMSFIKFHGFIAWVLWLLVHIMALVGFKNKIVTFVNWMWHYFSYDPGLRLIIRPYKKKKVDDSEEN